jgi:hypothetical protein
MPPATSSKKAIQAEDARLRLCQAIVAIAAISRLTSSRKSCTSVTTLIVMAYPEAPLKIHPQKNKILFVQNSVMPCNFLSSLLSVIFSDAGPRCTEIQKILVLLQNYRI